MTNKTHNNSLYTKSVTACTGDNVHLSYSFPSFVLGVFTTVM